ncbi:probable beta-1,4-xylosyltransferase IRX9H [Nicotiana tomentosiformis]|uniref:probable beta-1,4-xylosyltransferase IRX9H n=1 Tax=Nicotiana tomentosiformis TaxID=4098 RepID=UPI00051C8738|nr:probable beta-1,4-xylosyltransferase IRX9H [Nicotiana tomentosiformis]XP_009603737.1 probable beta-1,4-xylosyltransferase IRX9H [Nicotiana tomentosiformis]XP_009603738.1 probable beta-1,4-xylosyltransferase IRX9H [Nicotiana tomentosiformis]
MASIRRALSPVPRPGNRINGEACSVASPLSKSSSCNQSYTPAAGFLYSYFGSLDYAFYKVRTFVVGILSRRSSRPLERSKLKGQIWRKALLQFLMCFVLGVFIGLTPFVSLNLSANVMLKHKAFSFEVFQPYENGSLFADVSRNMTSTVNSSDFLDNSTSRTNLIYSELKAETAVNVSDNQSLDQDLTVSRKLLIIVTPTEARSFQAYYLNRLAHVLKLVPPPLLWIVVEMDFQSTETANILRRTGVMYRHLVCKKNSTEVKDKSVNLRNVALNHIETHRLDGIVYFADDSNIYSIDVFEQMRQISRFGTWVVARLAENNRKVILQGPICNGSQVIGWHTDGAAKRFQRFYAEISGFAFNSTVLWDPMRWNWPTLEPIRQLDIVKGGFQVSSFIEQVVEDESQMECFPTHCSRIMVWQFDTELLYPYPHEWWVKNYSGTITASV